MFDNEDKKNKKTITIIIVVIIVIIVILIILFLIWLLFIRSDPEPIPDCTGPPNPPASASVESLGEGNYRVSWTDTVGGQFAQFAIIRVFNNETCLGQTVISPASVTFSNFTTTIRIVGIGLGPFLCFTVAASNACGDSEAIPTVPATLPLTQ